MTTPASTTMKAIVCSRYGSPDVLGLKEVPTPTPKDDEILVKVQTAAINDYDWVMVTGKPRAYRLIFGLLKPKFGVLGVDVAGRVAAVGASVTAFRVGDEVYGDLSQCGFGAFAEYVCARERHLAHKPAGMSFAQAAAIPHAAMLAVQGLIDAGQIRDGQKVLINGAGGGVGTLGVQIAKRFGVEVTGVDSTEKLDSMRSVGFDHVVDYTREDFTRSGKRYDLILDTKTTRSPFAYARALSPGGAYVTVGGALPRVLQVFVLGPLISRIRGKAMRIVDLKPNKDLEYANGLFEAGKLTPLTDGPYALDEVPEALTLFGKAKHKGKVIINVAQEV